MTLGEAIRSLRSAAGLSQQQLAKDEGISPSYLSLVEADKREPTVSLLRLISKRLGTPAALLLAAALANSHAGSGDDAEHDAIAKLLGAARHLLAIGRLEDAVPTR